MNIKMQCRGVRSDFLAVHTNDDDALANVILAMHRAENTDADWGDVPNVILDPADALQLAIALMDWARDHMPKITPEMAAFGASYVAPFQQEYTSNPQDWGFDDDDDAIEWPYCQTCGSTLVNGQCPEKTMFDEDWIDDGADDWAVDGANQEWR